MKQQVYAFSNLLNNCLLNSPDLFDELPAILVALESGKSINIDNIKTERGKVSVQLIYDFIPKLIDIYGTTLKDIRRTIYLNYLH